jgi:simple sugar transport system ATP-binding protein
MTDIPPGGPGPGGGEPTVALAVRRVSKRFGKVEACSQVDLDVHRGEIHGLLGQNGAGKSTLAKIIVGLCTPDEGEILVNGRRAVVRELSDAIALGVGMVHQHFSLIEPLTVWENVTLGDSGAIEVDRLAAEIAELSDRYGLDVDPFAPVEHLTVGQRQRVEIIKCLRRNPDIVIFDEPTSSLTMGESRELFEVLRRVVRHEGRAVMLISHKLDEIMHATDRVTIMRNGGVVRTMVTAEADPPLLAREMVGRDVSLLSERAAFGYLDAGAQPDGDRTVVSSPTTPALRVRDAVARDASGRRLLDGLTIEVHAGEIVGVAGVEGNGQKALGDLLASLLRLESGSVEVDGAEVRTGRPGAMARAGIGIITEDRHTSSCVLSMSVAENLVMGQLDGVRKRFGWISQRRVRAHARALIEELGISTSSEDAPMWSLSGGNQQRVVLARELARQPKVLVAAQPTRGLDVGAIEYMNDRLHAIAADGVAVLLLSTELEEILALSDRVAVIHAGRIVGESARRELDIESLGLLMGGHST